MNKKIVFIAVIALAIDQITKIIASTFLKLNMSVQVINKFFYLTLCQNEGAAWGLFKNSKIVIILGTIVAIVLIYHFVYVFKENKRNDFAFGLLIGGLLGNLVDRIIFGYVRDFLDFYIFKYDYPIFNVADICIVIGVLFLMIAVLKGEDSNESSSNKSKRKNRQIPSE